MALGYSSAGSCFATTAEAIDNYYSQPMAVFNNASNAIFRPVKDGGVWKYERKATDTGSTIFITGALNQNVYGSCTLTASTTEDYSYTDAAAMWGFAFSTVIMLWYLAKNLGMIINAVKRW